MKKLAISLLAIIAITSIDMQGGRGGGGFRGGSRGGGRSWHGGGDRHWHGNGWGRDGWGVGAALIPAAITAGAIAASGDDTTYIEPVPVADVPVAPVGAADPYSRYQAITGVNPAQNPDAYHQWLLRNYPADANRWWNNFLSNQ